MNHKPKIAVIGAGFSGLTSAALLAQNGFKVEVFEKNSKPGGRCNQFTEEGFVFDMGPSWYWMPDVFERYFNRLGKSIHDYISLDRLDPSYQVIFKDETWEIPAEYERLKALLESHEKGSGAKLDTFMKEAGKKYQLAMQDLVYNPSLSWKEYLSWETMLASLQQSLFSSFSALVKKYFKNPKIIQLMEFPVLFLGAKPEKTPALFSIMNYADIQLGTWYPKGGMFEVSKAFEQLAKEQGVKIHYDSPVDKIITEGNKVTHIKTNAEEYVVDQVVSGADYVFTEQLLSNSSAQNYSDDYWEKKQFSPSCLLFYWGVDTEIPNLEHHNLFFDADFSEHSKEIYDSHSCPENPLFYVCTPSKTDATVAPEGKENIFVLIPISAGLTLNEAEIQRLKKIVIQRIQAQTGIDISDKMIVEKVFQTPDFISQYHSYKGNAYGLANTLMQTGPFRPSIRNKKLKNMWYCGQLTVPGPGMPPAIISGTIVADYIVKHHPKTRKNESLV